MSIGISFMEIAETSTKMYILKDIYCNIIYKSQNLLNNLHIQSQENIKRYSGKGNFQDLELRPN